MRCANPMGSVQTVNNLLCFWLSQDHAHIQLCIYFVCLLISAAHCFVLHWLVLLLFFFKAYFTELHSHSERSLQEKLAPLGSLYSQNTRLYGDLYTDLRQYYRGSALNLEETLSEFWSRLLERTFKSSSSDVSSNKDDKSHFRVQTLKDIYRRHVEHHYRNTATE